MNDIPSDSESRLAVAQQHLKQLQAEVDRLHRDNRAYRDRIEHLHSDREMLRRRAHELQTSLVRVQSRPGYRLRALLSDFFHGRIPVKKLGERVRNTLRRPDLPAPPGPPGPAFRPQELIHSSLIPATALPVPQPKRPDFRVAAIMDEFSQTAFSYEFDYLEISPTNWETELAERPDLLLVESSFVGNRGAWTNEVAGFCPPRQALADLTAWCKQNGIPTVFWNKEDPANFEWFIGAASAFDWVFTVDVNSIPRYRAELGHSRIAPLPFAAQPAINFPPPTDEDRTEDIAFAGSYYARKHRERRRQMEIILDPALEFGLDIFDRMGSLQDARFEWPEKYRPRLRGSLSYPQTTEAYRRYKIFLNVNTVTDSPTMCARRVFELLASGTPVVSGPALALGQMVPQDAILISQHPTETKSMLAQLLESETQRASLATAGINWIADGNTYTHRVDQVLGEIGLVR